MDADRKCYSRTSLALGAPGTIVANNAFGSRALSSMHSLWRTATPKAASTPALLGAFGRMDEYFGAAKLEDDAVVVAVCPGRGDEYVLAQAVQARRAIPGEHTEVFPNSRFRMSLIAVIMSPRRQ